MKFHYSALDLDLYMVFIRLDHSVETNTQMNYILLKEQSQLKGVHSPDVLLMCK